MAARRCTMRTEGLQSPSLRSLPMSDALCPHCGRNLSPAEVQGGRCYDCGKRLEQPPLATPITADPSPVLEVRLPGAIVERPRRMIAEDVQGWGTVRAGLTVMFSGTCLTLV